MDISNCIEPEVLPRSNAAMKRLFIIHTICLLVRSTFREFRKIDPDFDGKSAWQPLKHVLQQFNYIRINMILPKRIGDIKGDILQYDNCEEEAEEIHFSLQLVRLHKEHTIMKLVQIALNIGQLEGMMNMSLYIDASSYLDLDSIVDISIETLLEIQNQIENVISTLKRKYLK